MENIRQELTRKPLAPEIQMPLGTAEVTDVDGWNRLIIPTPFEGVSVMFKGREDLPELPKLDMLDSSITLSLRPLYEDEAKGLGGGAKKEAQTAYAGAHNSDPRLISSNGGVGRVLERVVNEAGGKNVLLIVDETPEGLKTLFQAVSELDHAEMLSDTARELAATQSIPGQISEVEKDLLDSIALDMATAVNAEKVTLHEALGLVYMAHVGSEDSRSKHRTILDELLKEKLLSEKIGEREPEEYEAHKARFIEVAKERKDYWVHRDQGLLRPGDKVLTGGAYVDYPRITTHGCINVAISAERNLYGGGGHGEAADDYATTVAAPLDEITIMNGLPVNYEAADTYWNNLSGMTLPESALYITISSAGSPDQLATNELWIPASITDEDLTTGENGLSILDDLSAGIDASILSGVLPEGTNTRDLVKRLINDSDLSPGTQAEIGHSLYAMAIEFYQNKLGVEFDKDSKNSSILFFNQLHDQISARSDLRFGGKPFDELYDHDLKQAAYIAFGSGEDQETIDRVFPGTIERATKQAREDRRAGYLQVALTNIYISSVRKKSTPRLESFGRGLDWDIPGQSEQIKADFDFAKSVGLQTDRHEAHMEAHIYHNMQGIVKNSEPNEIDYTSFAESLKDMPFAMITRLLRIGYMSWDQVNKVVLHEESFI